MHIDDKVISSIKEKISLSDYIAQYVDLKYVNGQAVGLCPFHDEKTPSFKVDVDDRFFHCFGCHKSGDILDFIQAYHKVSLEKAIKIAAKFGNIEVKNVPISDTIKICRLYNHKNNCAEFSHEIIPETELEKYNPTTISSWVNEGIEPVTMQKYDIRLDAKHERAIYPVRDINGNLINIKGRTLCDCWKELKIPKYINYFKVGRLDYFQGLCDAISYIKDNKEIIIFEGIKSCMKANQFGFNNVVSAETSILNQYQVRLLVSLGCNVTIAFDADKTLGDFANKELKMLTRFCNVYYINDREKLLGGKESKNSPVDLGADVWNELFYKRERVIV